jgi:hypothetical protein
MLKCTVLKFQGALGLLGFGVKGNDDDGDSGNSFTQASWEDENDDDKDSYLSTGALIPTHQPVSEIIVTRHRISGINSLLDAYKAKKKNIQQYCRVFDTKELVTKHDVDSKVWTKLPPKNVRSLAMDALKLATTKLADIEEVKGNQPPSDRLSSRRHSIPGMIDE